MQTFTKNEIAKRYSKTKFHNTIPPKTRFADPWQVLVVGMEYSKKYSPQKLLTNYNLDEYRYASWFLDTSQINEYSGIFIYGHDQLMLLSKEPIADEHLTFMTSQKY